MTAPADLTALTTAMAVPPSPGLEARYAAAVMNTFGPPKRVLVRGEGCWVWDSHGKRYLDLLAGIAVNALGHAHPFLVAALTSQLATLGHVSNFFATAPQVTLAQRLLDLLAPDQTDGRVFFANSGAEANEAALKVLRRTGRPKVVAIEGGFHGRTLGALSITGKPAIRTPFEPLLPGVQFVPFGDADALATAVDETCAGIVVEVIQGEGGVRPLPPGYLEMAGDLARRHGALLVIDEVQTGIGRTGSWFAFQQHGRVTPDVVTLAKGLGGGIPVGACVAFGPAASLLGPGSHGSTFGGNPLATMAGLAVLHVIDRDHLLESAVTVGEHLRAGMLALAHPMIAGVQGQGLLLGLRLRAPLAGAVAAEALNVGFIVNDVSPETVRLAPHLILTLEQVDEFLKALPGVLDAVLAEHSEARKQPQ